MSDDTIILPDPAPEPGPLSLELSIQRRNTEAFIASDPITLTLRYQERVELADGGFKDGLDQFRSPQTFRLIPQSDVMPLVQTPDGVQLLPTYVLLGEHDSDMARWDFFELEGVKFQIVSAIRPDYRVSSSAYERKADVARR